MSKSKDIYGHDVYKYAGDKIPFEVATAESTFYDSEEEAWCIDAFPADENDEGTVAALVYSDGRIAPLYGDTLEHPVITMAINTVLNEVFH